MLTDMRHWEKYAFVCLLLLTLFQSGSSSAISGSNVCHRQISYECQESYTESFNAACGFLGWNTCVRYRTAYRPATCYRDETYCCSGYTLVGGSCVSAGNCVPVHGGWSVPVETRRPGSPRCGATIVTVTRSCNNPAPDCGGDTCPGPATYCERRQTPCPTFWGFGGFFGIFLIMGMFGDPHFSTTDMKTYTFNGHGEYTLVNALDGEFLLQGRTRRAVDSDGLETAATVLSAVATKMSTSSSVQVNLEENELHLFVDNMRIQEFNDLADEEMLSFTNVRVSKGMGGSVVAEFSSGARVEVYQETGVLAMSMHLTDDYVGQTKGLMGVWNGDPDDDFTRPDGTILSTNATDEEIYDWGLLWEITEAESIFYYGNNSYADFRNQDPSYRPIFDPVFDDPELEREAREVCGDNKVCLFDASVTKNVTIGLGTLTAQERNLQIGESLVNSPPIIEGPVSLNVSVGDVVSFSFTATDLKGDPVTVAAETLPPGATFEYGGNTATVTWNVVDDDGPAMNFSATNSRDQTTLYTPQVNLCKCQNGGDCDFGTLADGEDPDGDLRVVACQCPSPYTGQFCEDFNECEAGTDDCGENAACVNGSGAYRCECEPGFYPNPNDTSCQDCPYGYRGYMGNCYRFWGGKNAQNYSGARQVCQENGGDIYMWRSAAAVAALKRKLKSDHSPSLWVGLSDEDLEGTFLWADGLALGGNDFTDWSPNQPRNTAEKDCVVGRRVHWYRWKVVPCSYRRAFICQSPRAL
ncbi:mucin-like protein [Branchiostoma floridae]|uniref:Mucin-like protein n=1 Tax=Branchiostoma floridae TaxID=7739 RepID=A0A9J7KWF5_BRAFL|nr:mucin-like protein [Branchiostoma floridae]